MSSDVKGRVVAGPPKTRNPPRVREPPLPASRKERAWRGLRREGGGPERDDDENVDYDEEHISGEEEEEEEKKPKESNLPVPESVVVLLRQTGNRVSRVAPGRVALLDVASLFLLILEDHPVGCHFNIPAQAASLGTKKRRLQDVLAVFGAVGLVTRPCKNTGLWMGCAFMQEYLRDHIAPMPLVKHAADFFSDMSLSMFQVASFMAACVLQGVFHIGDSPRVIMTAVNSLLASPAFAGQVLTKERTVALMRRLYDVAAVMASMGQKFRAASSAVAPTVVSVSESLKPFAADVQKAADEARRAASHAKKAQEDAKAARRKRDEEKLCQRREKEHKKRVQNKKMRQEYEAKRVARKRAAEKKEQQEEDDEDEQMEEDSEGKEEEEEEGVIVEPTCTGKCRCCLIVQETKRQKTPPPPPFLTGEDDSTASMRASGDSTPLYSFPHPPPPLEIIPFDRMYFQEGIVTDWFS